MAQKAVEAVAEGDAGELLGVNIGGPEASQLARREPRVEEVVLLGEEQVQNSVADVLQSVVGVADPRSI